MNLVANGINFAMADMNFVANVSQVLTLPHSGVNAET